jgi:hypothetical protein
LEQYEKVENLKKILCNVLRNSFKKRKAKHAPKQRQVFLVVKNSQKAMIKNMVLKILWKISKTKMKI